jgi:formiminoglutamate deiminase
VTLYHAEYAWLGPAHVPRIVREGAGRNDPPPGNVPADAGLVSDVLIEVADGRFAAVTPSVRPAPAGAVRLAGLTLPGLANAHSHAFHRALRGRTHAGTGTFWTWRDQMYALAARLDPVSYLALARATYAEMALAGVTCVGEFHYLHHGPDGTPYADPNEMGAALVTAAQLAGIRITLLDTCYLASGVDGAALEAGQRRFGDGDADGWAARVDRMRISAGHAKLGAAIHSVRAVPADQIPTVVGWAAEREAPLHLHLSEQRAENDACVARHGRTPAELLAELGALGPGTTAVHATHLTATDRALLGGAGTGVCLCPTTERDLADGIGPGRALADAGCPLSLGSDSHAVIDLFEEARAVELDERLRSQQRGHFTVDELLCAATVAGHQALGWADAGRIAPGARADLVTVRLDSARTAGVDPAGAVFAATAADVRHVVVDGRVVVKDGEHTDIDVSQALRTAIGALV